MSKKPSICPLTGNPELRRTAAAITAAIQDQFPSGLSQPALRALASAGYTSLEQLTHVSDKELLALHGMGPKGVRILRAALNATH